MLENLRRRLRIARPGSAGKESPHTPVPPHLEGEAERVGSLCFSALYDWCCWMAHAMSPVAENVDRYIGGGIGDIADPRQRLAKYCDPRLLELWDAALAPYLRLSTVCGLAPELGDDADMLTDGLGEDKPRIQAEMTMRNTSSLGMADRTYPLPHAQWHLYLMVSIDTTPGYVHDAALRRPDPLEPTGSGAPMIDPFALLAAVPQADPEGWLLPVPPAQRLWPDTNPSR